MMKQYIVIGCGRFGSSVATTMSLLGHQVMAIDKSEEIVQNIVDKVTHAAIVDVTDELALRSIGLGNFDVAIIAIGSDTSGKGVRVDELQLDAKNATQRAINPSFFILFRD